MTKKWSEIIKFIVSLRENGVNFSKIRGKYKKLHENKSPFAKLCNAGLIS